MFTRALTTIILGLSVIVPPLAYGNEAVVTHPPNAAIQAVQPVADSQTNATFIPLIGPVKRVALMFVGHGEPTTVEDGDVPVVFPDGSAFGPHGVELGVPEAYQHTEWAAAYEEIATAISYIFGDTNGNGVEHELGIAPHGDVPDFFTWEAFHASIYDHYDQCQNYSPHNDTLVAHLSGLNVRVKGARIDVFLALLDDVPRIPDVIHEISQGDYDELVVVPMLVSNSTHTDEIADQMEDMSHLTRGMEVLVTEPFFEVPYMRKSLGEGIVATAYELSKSLPAGVEDHNIGVLLASHGTPYVPPFAEFGWVAADSSVAVPDADTEWTADRAFAEYIAREVGVAVVPGSSFYAGRERGTSRVRLNFAKQESTLHEAARRLQKLRPNERG